MSNAHFAGETGRVINIPLSMVWAMPQVRTTFKESSIAELAADIEAHGLLQPIVVCPDGNGYKVVIGERRLRALKKANAEFAPAIIANIGEEEREEIQLIENIQREDLSVKDLSNFVHKLWKKYNSVPEVAKRCGKSKSWVVKRLSLAMNIGPMTAQLLDANAKDTELLYAFATLEKADDRRARALLPDLLEKKKGRKHVQEELQVALGKKTEDKSTPEESTEAEPKEENAAQPSPPSREEMALAEKLRIALNALNVIKNAPLAINPADKAHYMRRAALEALEKIDAA